MQNSEKTNLNPNSGTQILTHDETATLGEALQAMNNLLAVHPHNFGGEWSQVFWKISLAMTRYFAECPDEPLFNRYLTCMELFSDFVAKMGKLDEPVLQKAMRKLKG